MTLKLENPCGREDYLQIETVDLPQGEYYTLHQYGPLPDDKYKFTHDPFIIQASDAVKSLCGELAYTPQQ